jgi:hypothetical protein
MTSGWRMHGRVEFEMREEKRKEFQVLAMIEDFNG